MSTTTLTPALPGQTSRAQHPPGLSTLFFTEMWERFSYYGIRALLVMYLVESLHYERKDALALYGTYTGLVFFTPLIGGYIADRWLGVRNAVFVGMLTMMLGHFAMAVDGLLHLALGLLVVGNGFFKANTTAMVGQLYPPDDPRIPAGYTLFYMGINIGSASAGLIAGQLGEKVGYHLGFASAGVGMALGILILLRGQHRLEGAGLLPGQARVTRKDWSLILALCATSVPLVLGVLALWQWFSAWWDSLGMPLQLMVALACVLAAVCLPRLRPSPASAARQPLTQLERRRIGVIALMSLFAICFYLGFEQAGGTLSLFAKHSVDRQLWGYELPASQFQMINPLAVIALSPLFAMLWARWRLPDFSKQGIGLLILGLSFCVMSQAQSQADLAGLVGMQWLLLVYLMHTLAELMIVPIGLSLASRLAPARLAAVVMGIWMLAKSAANLLAGRLEAWLSLVGLPLFWFLAMLAGVGGVLLLILSPRLSRFAELESA